MSYDTTVRVDRDTLEELFAFKTSTEDTYDDVIRRMMNECEHLKSGANSAEGTN